MVNNQKDPTPAPCLLLGVFLWRRKSSNLAPVLGRTYLEAYL
jgi:hypothetical protein